MANLCMKSTNIMFIGQRLPPPPNACPNFRSWITPPTTRPNIFVSYALNVPGATIRLRLCERPIRRIQQNEMSNKRQLVHRSRTVIVMCKAANGTSLPCTVMSAAEIKIEKKITENSVRLALDLSSAKLLASNEWESLHGSSFSMWMALNLRERCNSACPYQQNVFHTWTHDVVVGSDCDTNLWSCVYLW